MKKNPNSDCINNLSQVAQIILCKIQNKTGGKTSTDSCYLAAMPPCRRFETLGFPSLSMPPDTVRPSVVPSFFISSTTEHPRNSSISHQEQAMIDSLCHKISAQLLFCSTFIYFIPLSFCLCTSLSFSLSAQRNKIIIWKTRGVKSSPIL